MRSIAALLVVASAVLACQSSDSKSAPAPTTAAAQIEHGKNVYVHNCARCHGDAGQGTAKAPPVVGPNALPLDPRPKQKRAIQFHTAMDVATFVTKNMPPDADDRAKLHEVDYWAVLAFDLSANGVKLDQTVGPHNAASFVLHP